MFFHNKLVCTVKEMQLHSILFIEFRIALKFGIVSHGTYQNKKLLKIVMY